MDGGLTRRLVLKTGLAVAGAMVAPPAFAAATPALPWPAASDIVANTKPPTFPDVTFKATAYGAVGDNKTDNTAAFKNAIEDCSAAGGGHVTVPAGTYVTGAVHLRSNVDFHLESGCTLKSSSDGSKFPNVLTRYEGIESVNRSPMVYAYGQTNIALTGPGVLDAGALYVKSNTRRGGFSQNINLDSVSGVFGRAIVFVTSTYNNQAGDYPPVFGPFTGVGSTSNVLNHVDNVKFTNVTVNGKPV